MDVKNAIQKNIREKDTILYGKQGVKSQSQAHHAKNVEKHCL
jgi:hypothetical protein